MCGCTLLMKNLIWVIYRTLGISSKVHRFEWLLANFQEERVKLIPDARKRKVIVHLYSEID